VKHKIWLIAGLVALAAALAAVGIAAAAGEVEVPLVPNLQLRQGHVLEIGTDSFVVETRRGDLTVLVDDNTRFRIPGVAEPGLDDLAVGDHVGFAGRLAGDGELLARLIVRLPRPRDLAHVRGELTAKSGDSFELARPDQVVITVLVSDQTRFRVPDVEDPGLDDLAIGDTVVADGRWNDAGQVEARLITLVPEDVATVIRGEVTAVADPEVHIWTPAGPVTLFTDANTRLFIPGIENPTLADVQVGDRVTAGGEIVPGGLDTAVIRVVPAGSCRAVRRGVVTANDGSTLTLSTPRGELLVTADANTRIRIPGAENPTLADIQVGYQAVVAGLLDPAGNTLLARLIGARPAPSSVEIAPGI
jgi:hypothetical protein